MRKQFESQKKGGGGDRRDWIKLSFHPVYFGITWKKTFNLCNFKVTFSYVWTFKKILIN